MLMQINDEEDLVVVVIVLIFCFVVFIFYIKGTNARHKCCPITYTIRVGGRQVTRTRTHYNVTH